MAIDATEIAATSLRNYGMSFADNIFLGNPSTALMQKKGAITLEDGGDFMTEQVVVDKPDGEWHEYDATLSQTTKSIAKYSDFIWRFLSIPVKFFDLEEIKNRGKGRLKNLIKLRIANAENAGKELMTIAFFNDGSVTSSFKGIQYIILEKTGTGANQATTGNVGTLSRASVSAWRNWSWGTAITAFATLANGRKAMNAIYQKCSYGVEKPDIVVTTEDIWALYEIELFTNGTINLPYNAEMAGMGWDNLAFKNKPLVADKSAPDGNMYFLNTKHLFIRLIRDKNCKVTPFRSPVNAPHSHLAYVQLMGCITSDGLRYLGVINSITG